MERKKSVFHFNHIDPEHQEETLNELKQLYEFYHRVWFCYKELHRKSKHAFLFSNLLLS